MRQTTAIQHKLDMYNMLVSTSESFSILQFQLVIEKNCANNLDYRMSQAIQNTKHVTHMFVLKFELYGFLHVVIECTNPIVTQHPKACMKYCAIHAV